MSYRAVNHRRNCGLPRGVRSEPFSWVMVGAAALFMVLALVDLVLHAGQAPVRHGLGLLVIMAVPLSQGIRQLRLIRQTKTRRRMS